MLAPWRVQKIASLN